MFASVRWRDQTEAAHLTWLRWRPSTARLQVLHSRTSFYSVLDPPAEESAKDQKGSGTNPIAGYVRGSYECKSAATAEPTCSEDPRQFQRSCRTFCSRVTTFSSSAFRQLTPVYPQTFPAFPLKLLLLTQHLGAPLPAGPLLYLAVLIRLSSC